MSQQRPIAILFADVSGSTKIFELQGDVRARQIISAMLNALTEVVLKFNGRVIKTIGDEIMCTFPDGVTALHAACEMQRRISRDPGFSREALAIRIGLHYGDALVEEHDVFGDAVNTAARMAGLAKREQIVTTASTVKGLTNSGGLRVRSLGKARVSGKLLPIEVVDVLWQEDISNITTVQRAIRVDESASGAKLVMRFRGQVIELSDVSPPFLLGRDQNNDLVVDAEWVSRNHAMIEYRRGMFVLSDRSTNGTYVKLGEDEEFRLHRDEIHLRTAGSFALGQSVTKDPGNVLYFQGNY